MKRLFTISIGFLVFAVLGIAHGEMRTHGAWISDTAFDYSEAYTTNDSGSSLGMICFSESQTCLYYLRSDITCDDGSITIGLINTDYGSYSIELQCTEVDFGGYTEFVNIFTDYDLIETIVLENYNFAMALPMESGLFKVIRFDLTGSNEAIDEAINSITYSTGDDYFL